MSRSNAAESRRSRQIKWWPLPLSMVRGNAKGPKLVFNRRYDDLLEGEYSLRVNVGLGGKIEIDVLNVQVELKVTRSPRASGRFRGQLRDKRAGRSLFARCGDACHRSS